MPEPITRPVPRRIRVVGNSGSGKTTYARTLSGILGVPHLELDAVFWAESWTKRDEDEARQILHEFLAAAPNGWVADGNWDRGRRTLLDDVDALVWLDHSRWTVMSRVIRRTVVRGVTRRELWHGNRESLRSLLSLDPDKNVVLWSWTQHTAYRRKYGDLAARGDVPMVRLRGQRAARQWLRWLTDAA